MYETFYNFSEPPFRLTPDPRFYYSSATHMRALKHLRFGFHQREGFVVITGKPGTGKTELMLHLLENLPQDRISYGKIVTSNLDENEVLQQVAAAFQIPAEGVRKGILLKRLEDYFLQHVRDKKRLVLIVDEAHKLSINSLNELQMLTNFQLSGKSALQCFLSGHDNLKLKLNEPELLHLKQRVITSTFLTPLERNETQEYIEHRLRCVGWTGDPKFNQYAYALIHETTEGIPRQINLLCNRVLLRALAEQKHYIDEGLASRAIEDVNAEPLAEEQYFEDQPSIAIDSNAYNRTPAYPYNDQDETLPFPSVVNFSNSANGNDAMVHIAPWMESSHVGHSVGRTQSYSKEPAIEPAKKAQTFPPQSTPEKYKKHNIDTDREVVEEAQKLSDALSDFHKDIALKTKPLDAKPRQIPKPDNASVKPRTGSTTTIGASLKKPSTPVKPAKGAAPFIYGTVVFLLIAAGLSIWVYNFSNDVLEPAQPQAENPTDDTLVASIKELLPEADSGSAVLSQEDSVVEEQADGVMSNPDNPLKDMKSQHATTANNTADKELAYLNTIDTEIGKTAKQNQAADTTLAQAENVGGDALLDNEQWDSGALGGKFLDQGDGENNKQNVTDIQGDSSRGKAETRIAKTDENSKNISARPIKAEQAQKKQPPNNKATVAKVGSPTSENTNTVNTNAVNTNAVNNNAVKKPAAKTGKPVTKIAKAKANKSTKQVKQTAKQKIDKAGKGKSRASAAASLALPHTAKSAPQTNIEIRSNTAPAVTKITGNDKVDAEQLNKLLKTLTAAYEKGNIKQLLSLPTLHRH